VVGPLGQPKEKPQGRGCNLSEQASDMTMVSFLKHQFVIVALNLDGSESSGAGFSATEKQLLFHSYLGRQ
jgi:hypothetical protein